MHMCIKVTVRVWVCVRAYVWKLEYFDVNTTDLFLAKMEKEPRLVSG